MRTPKSGGGGGASPRRALRLNIAKKFGSGSKSTKTPRSMSYLARKSLQAAMSVSTRQQYSRSANPRAYNAVRNVTPAQQANSKPADNLSMTARIAQTQVKSQSLNTRRETMLFGDSSTVPEGEVTQSVRVLLDRIPEYKTPQGRRIKVAQLQPFTALADGQRSCHCAQSSPTKWRMHWSTFSRTGTCRTQ